MDLAEARARTSGEQTAESRHPWETARLDVVDRLIAAHVRLAPDSTVLDVGCGDTFVAEQLSARYPGARFCAVDTAFTEDLRRGLSHPSRWHTRRTCTPRSTRCRRLGSRWPLCC